MKTAIGFTIAIFATVIGSIVILFSGYPLWALAWFATMLCGMIVAIIKLVATAFQNKRENGAFPNLEQRADLLSLSGNTDEIKQFIYSKGTYLGKKSYQKLLSRLELLEADKTIFEDNLKARIDATTPSVIAEEFEEDTHQTVRRLG